MSRPLPPTITVRTGGWQRTFAPGRDIVVGRDVRADVRIAHLGVSRSHVLLRYSDGRWVAFDDKSFNGMFVGNQRVHSVDIRDGQTINVGDPDGPRLTFELGPTQQPDDRPTSRMPRETKSQDEPETRVTTRIGRASDNDVVIPDVLASNHHASLVSTPRGIQIQDAGSANGTFVNGEPVKEAVLTEDDVVTIGNVDFVFTGSDLVRRSQPATKTGGLEVHDVSLTIEGAVTLLDRISLTARPGTLTAVIGPSGSGKTTLAKAIIGATRPTSGTVSFDGHDVHAENALLRNRIGMVPQDDVVHRKLTVIQALGYAAELRMPPDTSSADRQRVVTQVLDELELMAHAQTRVDKLSGGQRKRVSVAMELLTGPSLLVLDEPTTGLDPALDRTVMAMLRHLADAGRAIVVVTHSLTYLDDCDQVLLLAPGGKTAFCGAPSDLGPAMGSTDWADVFDGVRDDPDGALQRHLARTGPVVDLPTQVVTVKPVGAVKPARPNPWRQFSTVARRQVQLIIADRGYVALLVALPFIVGLLPLTVAGHAGFGAPPPGAPPFEPKQIIALLNFGAILLGTTLTVRDLTGERVIFRREQAVGLSASAYLAAKIAVFGAVAVIQSAILTLVVTAPKFGKPAPPSAAALGIPLFELFVGVAATCVGAMALGLAVSALAKSSEQVIVLLAATLVTQLVLAGGFIPVTNRPLLETISLFTPARWGFAATASTADLSNLVVIAKDAHWQHTASAWLFDIAMLGVLSIAFAGIARWRIRVKSGG
ncbi:ATP-binding cassette domain-containing protein [Mycolicibacterium sp. P9-64]|uniref:ATP-binding cassette domain-containing protein n=1 Tax=Mycolicibacterium sp. P9-64 TaxID=2024612 RepID=UPI0011ECC7CA|nr:ATP-binding cassette domain-containing protein [Mycolicibacterium sp. P9-64]KAA0082821.1 ATP-binding cassette domain-containing protein [Mycolicibacterium sp. P9-64]